ncbi:MAG: hypothetical protein IPJ12_02250 [Betaproteobacteria bacterium]|nr:hypothetical protein [Betaproteobacteria bacterium]
MLELTVKHAILAIPDDSIIDIVINGNESNVERFVERLALVKIYRPIEIYVWSIKLADKGNAWNTHIHKIWRDNGLDVVYIDGYVRVDPSSIDSICRSMLLPEALGSSGLPSIGKSAKAIRKEMLKNGGFHGNFCGISHRAMKVIKTKDIRIPIGMYRVDSIMGAFLSFGLDNVTNPWLPKKYIPIAIDATWHVDEKRWFRVKDILAFFKRKRRQAKGIIENAALKYHLVILKIPLNELPRHINQIISRWYLDNEDGAKTAINESKLSFHEFDELISKNFTDDKINQVELNRKFTN